MFYHNRFTRPTPAMLPIETFTDVVGFLRYFDLGGLKLAAKSLNTIADRCADAIRLYDFSNFTFQIYDGWIIVYRHESDGSALWVCQLELDNEEAMAEFISEAFRNCVVGQFYLGTRRGYVLDAINLVTNTVAIVDSLCLPKKFLESKKMFYDFIDSFHHVKVCLLE